ncbi:hypothetical protein MLD38_030786 [Melastoma candidum]|uniref:Uncharacterized protein n=1 Tax=Melastoma candidum TaxID=119954 RepID=A0ACB9MN81_9MYRT|nr:hypothetical protein MLD38_030786 [Melastoma candidum]
MNSTLNGEDCELTIMPHALDDVVSCSETVYVTGEHIPATNNPSARGALGTMPAVHEALVRLILVLPIFATFKEPVISFLRQRESGGGGGMGRPLGAGNGSAPFFIFGDSLLDAGNNDYLNVSFKANRWPYGETFFHNATGRFCNGRIPPDFIAENANLPFIKPYLEPNFSDYTDGANFASGGAGVLPQTLEGALYLELQVSLFAEMTERLKQQKGDSDAQKLISRGVYHIGMGGNDYIHLATDSLDDNATISPHDKEAFVHWVMGNLTTSINRLYRLGGRKFSFQNVAPIGCLPGSRYRTGTGGCLNDLNILAEMHNEALSELLAGLEKDLSGFNYVLFDYYKTLLDRIVNCTEFGFEVGETACCGSGTYNGEWTCGVTGDHFTLCRKPKEYVFFDPAHPTEEVSRQLSELMWSGEPPVMRPGNLKSLFEEP